MDQSGHFTRMWTRCGLCKLFRTGCILGRTPRTKETLLNFREWFRVTRHPRVFRRLTCCQRGPRDWGVTFKTRFSTKLVKEVFEKCFEEQSLAENRVLKRQVWLKFVF